MESRQYDWLRRAARTLLQLIASGALLELTQQVAGDIPATYSAYVFIAYTVLVTAAQNAAEDHVSGFPALLKGKASGGANPVPDPGP